MKKILFIPMLAFTLLACGGSQTSKYGSNTFITENGTCYVRKATNGYLFSLVLLKADGTGSASRYYNNEQSSWEFTYVIENEKDLYFPWFNGDSMHFEFSVNSETSLREMEHISNVWVEYTGEY